MAQSFLSSALRRCKCELVSQHDSSLRVSLFAHKETHLTSKKEGNSGKNPKIHLLCYSPSFDCECWSHHAPPPHPHSDFSRSWKVPKSRNQFAGAINDGEKLHQFAVINDKLIVQVFCDWRLKLEHQIERALESYGLKNVHHEKKEFSLWKENDIEYIFFANEWASCKFFWAKETLEVVATTWVPSIVGCSYPLPCKCRYNRNTKKYKRNMLKMQ